MPINLSNPEMTEMRPRIVVFGVGGAGGNAVNNMIKAELQGVDFVAANTDAQALAKSSTDNQVQLGAGITQGLGAGMKPDIGRQSAEEALGQIQEYLDGSHMCFIAAGMGGGTGTGAAPVIARAAREMGVLTVGVVTKPFQFEGKRRMTIAEDGVKALQAEVDTLIVIPNQNLFRVANENTTFADAFTIADEVLHSGVRSITDLMVEPGLINLDFADVRTVMSEMGKALMGTGEAEGEDRAARAAADAIANPLLEDLTLKSSQGVLINVTGGMDMTLHEVDEAANIIREEVDEDANIIIGSILDPELEGKMRVSIVATGIDAISAQAADPASQGFSGFTPRVVTSNPEPAPTAAPETPATTTAPSGTSDLAAGNPIFNPAPAQSAGRMTSASMGNTATALKLDEEHAADDEPELFGRTETTEEAELTYKPVVTPKALEDIRVPSAPRKVETVVDDTASDISTPRDTFLPEPPMGGTMVADEVAETRPKRARGFFGKLFGGAKQEQAQPETGAEPRLDRNNNAENAADSAQTRLDFDAEAATKQKSLVGEDTDIPAFLRRQAN